MTTAIDQIRRARPDDGDPAFGAEIAMRAELQLLAHFWEATRDHASRLALLLAYTRITVIRPPTWNTEAIREAHRINHGAAETIRVTQQRCFACEASVQLYAHHVIEIQNGGSNHLRNQVPLCFDCHQYLHPWLTEADRAPAKPKSGFVSVADMAARIRL